jgi:hypothetical protein
MIKTRRSFLASLSAAAMVSSLPAPLLAANTTVENVLDYGAGGGGKTVDTNAMQSAINACANRGGGTVLLPAGHTFVSGTLQLRSHVDLHIENGATLKASGNRDDFRKYGSLLFAQGAAGFSVSGRGTIDGNGPAFLQERVAGGYKVLEPFLGLWDPLYDIPGIDHPDGRPRVILLVESKGFSLEDFTIRDSPTWTIHLLGCEQVHVSGLVIRNGMDVPNCDGMDIDHCRDVRIHDCDIAAGDDCLVLKTSRNFNQFGPCERVTISGCVLTSSSAAIKVEAEGPDAIRQAVIDNCVIHNSNRGICVTNRDGALVEEMVFSNMTIETSLRPEMWWGAGEAIQVTNLPRRAGTAPGTVRGLHFSNISCQAESGMYLQGCQQAPMEDLSFNDVELQLRHVSPFEGGFRDVRPVESQPGLYKNPIAAVYAEWVNNLRLSDVSLQWSANPPGYYASALEAHHLRGFRLEGFAGRAAHTSVQDVVLEDVEKS